MTTDATTANSMACVTNTVAALPPLGKRTRTPGTNAANSTMLMSVLPSSIYLYMKVFFTPFKKLLSDSPPCTDTASTSLQLSLSRTPNTHTIQSQALSIKSKPTFYFYLRDFMPWKYYTCSIVSCWGHVCNMSFRYGNLDSFSEFHDRYYVHAVG